MTKIKNEDTQKIGLGEKSINKEEENKNGYQYWAHGTWLIKGLASSFFLFSEEIAFKL